MTASRSELRRILVVDDDPDVRSVISLSLGRVGKMEVVEAHSGHDAIERLRRGTFDAIVLDVMMPGLDGPSTLERIRSEFGDSTTPVIFITAYPEQVLTGRSRPSKASLAAAAAACVAFGPWFFRPPEAR